MPSRSSSLATAAMLAAAWHAAAGAQPAAAVIAAQTKRFGQVVGALGRRVD